MNLVFTDRMYKVTYLMLALYSGTVYFFYLPAYKYMIENYNSNSFDLLLFITYIWMTWILKTLFGYIGDTYFICGQRIIPYAIFGLLVNLCAFTAGTVLSKNKVLDHSVFMAIFIVIFTSFSFIDSIARIFQFD